MFEESQYSQAILKTKEPRVSAGKAREYWSNIDAQLTATMVRNPTQVWIRQFWVPKEGENDCGKAKLVLRYRPMYPPQLQGLISPQEWQAFIAELNSADELRDGCIDKCTGLTLFILLFYLTIIGIFFYMCAEYSCNKRRMHESMKRKKACLARFNTKYSSRGITIAGRYDYRLAEVDDQGVDSTGEFYNDYLYLCITLPRPVMITTTTTAMNNGMIMPSPMMMMMPPSYLPQQQQQQPMMMNQMGGGLYLPQQPGYYPNTHPQSQQPPPQSMYPPSNGYDKNIIPSSVTYTGGGTSSSTNNTLNPYASYPVTGYPPPTQSMQQTPPMAYGTSPYPPPQANMMMMNTSTNGGIPTNTTPSAPSSDDPM